MFQHVTFSCLMSRETRLRGAMHVQTRCRIYQICRICSYSDAETHTYCTVTYRTSTQKCVRTQSILSIEFHWSSDGPPNNFHWSVSCNSNEWNATPLTTMVASLFMTCCISISFSSQSDFLVVVIVHLYFTLFMLNSGITSPYFYLCLSRHIFNSILLFCCV